MVQRTVDEFGRLDILVNNAGALWWKPVLETPLKRYDLMWEVNVRGAFMCAQTALPHMIAERLGPHRDVLAADRHRAQPGIRGLHDHQDGHDPAGDRHRRRARDDNVACNSLWPVTLIESLATINWRRG